jgi:hypothetical protein
MIVRAFCSQWWSFPRIRVNGPLLHKITYISNIYIDFTQNLGMIGVFGPVNNLCQAPPLGHTQKFKNVSTSHEKYYCNAIAN